MEMVRQVIAEELGKLSTNLGAERYESMGFKKAAEIYESMMTSPQFPEFLTLVAYKQID
jgi:malate synthase